jgi:3-hydroxyisobutyrate dehydrogenase-like beta-hydroxyacid dehydrogenase
MKVAFFGLGIMGNLMARNVARAGHALTVWNRTRAKADTLAAELAECSVRSAPTPADAARDAEAAITMLADPAALKAVVAGPDGIFATLGKGALLCDMSTVDPATIGALYRDAKARGIDFVDAPVSGSRKPATDGKLIIMAAGDDAAVARATPLLSCMGGVRHIGASGAGSSLKLILNSLGAHMMTGYCNALVLAQKFGLDPARAVEVIQAGSFSSPLYGGKTPKVLARDFSPDFSLALMLKDQELVLATARAQGFDIPSLETIRAEIERAIAAGFGDLDLTALVRLFETRAGVTVGK